jgi:tetratricopeptide (TPR) repeat protein
MCDGDVPGALQHIDTAIALARQQSADLLHGYCMMMKAELFIAVGDMDQARMLLQQVLDGPVGSVVAVESCTQGLVSRLNFEEGDYEAAIASGLRMLSVCESYGFEVRVESHLLLAEAYCAQDNLDEAAAHLERARALCPPGPTVWDAQLLLPEVSIALCRGESSEALRLAERHFAWVDQAPNVLLQCGALGVLGHAQLAAAKPEMAAETFQRLIGTAAVGPFPVRQADGHEGLAAALTALGHSDEAYDHLDTGTAIRQRATSRRVPRTPAEALLTRLQDLRAPDACRRS